MKQNAHVVDQTASTTTEHSQSIAYHDGDALVVCDRTNPNAWIRSDTWTTTQ